MSDAKVQFGANMETFSFQCPKYDRKCGDVLIANSGHNIPRDGQNNNGGQAQWDWDGNKDAPTFSPSINCKGCWHGYIRNGRCVDTSGKEE